jgi:hypothetical protein
LEFYAFLRFSKDISEYSRPFFLILIPRPSIVIGDPSYLLAVTGLGSGLEVSMRIWISFERIETEGVWEDWFRTAEGC